MKQSRPRETRTGKHRVRHALNRGKPLLIGQSGVVTTVAVVLAAGAGSRFEGPTHKLLASLNPTRDPDDTVVGRAIAAARESAIGPVVVVIGAVDLPVGATHDCQVVSNSRWADGQATSVRCGVDAARRLGADVIVVGLGDQPFVTAAAWRAVAEATTPIAVATYDGVRGNPVRLHESVWSLLPMTGDTGARDLIRLRPDLVSEVACAGSSADIDTQEDLESWT